MFNVSLTTVNIFVIKINKMFCCYALAAFHSTSMEGLVFKIYVTHKKLLSHRTDIVVLKI